MTHGLWSDAHLQDQNMPRAIDPTASNVVTAASRIYSKPPENTSAGTTRAN